MIWLRPFGRLGWILALPFAASPASSSLCPSWGWTGHTERWETKMRGVGLARPSLLLGIEQPKCDYPGTFGLADSV